MRILANTPSGTKREVSMCPPQNTKPPNEWGIAPHSPSGSRQFLPVSRSRVYTSLYTQNI